MRLGLSLIIFIMMSNIVLAKSIKLKDSEIGCNSFRNILKLVYLNENKNDEDDEEDEIIGCSKYSTNGKKARVLRTKDISKKSKKYSKAILVKYINTSCDGFAFWIVR